MSRQPLVARSRMSGTGFTMLEVLIVVLIIGLLIGLLLPAIQAAREVARRMQCQSNMSQLSIATSSYYLAYNQYPAGTVGAFSPVEDFPGDYHHSWLIGILPFIEQHTLLRDLDATRSVYDPANLPITNRHHEMDLLSCSSSWNSYDTSATSYAAVYSGNDEQISIDAKGPFVLNHFFQRDQIKDGLATTLFLGEKRIYKEYDLGWASGTHATLRTTGVPMQTGEQPRDIGGSDWQPGGFGGEITSDIYDDKIYGFAAYGWYLGDQTQSLNKCRSLIVRLDDDELTDQEYKQLYDEFLLGLSSDQVTGELVSAFDNLPTAPAIAGSPELDVRPFGSSHAGGVNFVYGDGHLQFISDTIDATTYGQLGNRSDSAPLSRD